MVMKTPTQSINVVKGVVGEAAHFSKRMRQLSVVSVGWGVGYFVGGWAKDSVG